MTANQTINCFDRIIGLIEDIVISSEFQAKQNEFLERNFEIFTEDEENKICYTEIFTEYTSIVESFIMERLKANATDDEMNHFLTELNRNSNRTFDGEIYELLYSFTDFETFKSLILDYKRARMDKGRSMALNDCFIVKKL